MKKLFAFLLAFAICHGIRATVLFPHFVDIAPEWEEGLPEVMKQAGVDCGMYYGTKPDFLLKTFTMVENFFNDTLPDDVIRDEKMVGECKLVKYYSINRKSDTIATDPLISVIYLLQLPEDRYMTVYCENSGNN